MFQRALAMPVAAVLAGCGGDVAATGSGHLAGQVVVSGPLRGATLQVEQIDLGSASGAVRADLGELVTDDDGRFSLETGELNGMFRLRARGGLYVDVVSGETLILDESDEMTSLHWLGLGEERDDVLVSPVGHLTEVLAVRLLGTSPQLNNLEAALPAAEEHVHRHFGQVDWQRVVPANLHDSATSPTESVRAALVLTGLSMLAGDIAQAAEASAQEVQGFELMRVLAADLAEGPFNGNDNNQRGGGLQLGQCAAPIDCVIPADACAEGGACRTLCDVYQNTARSLLASAMVKVVKTPSLNGTGLDEADTVAVARALGENRDQELFGNACTENLDRLPPVLQWNLGAAEGGAVVRGELAVSVTAIDDVDPSPRVWFEVWADADGDALNDHARAVIATAELADGLVDILAVAEDQAGNRVSGLRRVRVDNTAPEVELSPEGFFVAGDVWWTDQAMPALRGRAVDSSDLSVVARVAGVEVASTTAAAGGGGQWLVTLPPQVVPALGAEVELVVRDAAGNATTVRQRVRYDATAPSVEVQATSRVRDESGDLVDFITEGILKDVPRHKHLGNMIDLTVAGECPVVTKYSYLLDEAAPAYGREINNQGQSERNPLAYRWLVADDGVGIDPTTVEFRVGRVETGGQEVTWLVDWTSAGAGEVVAPGVFGYVTQMVRAGAHPVPGLGTTEGVYHVELRLRDVMGRATTAARCWQQRLLAPPLRFDGDDAHVSVTHPYALSATGLGAAAPYDNVAAKFFAASPLGASLLDLDVWNGTGEPVYFTAELAATPTVNLSRSFALRTTTTATTAINVRCDIGPGLGNCAPPDIDTAPLSFTDATTSSALPFAIRVFETDSLGFIQREVLPCAGCKSDGRTQQFELPGRSGLGISEARRYLVTTMVARVDHFRPASPASPSDGPFTDFALNGVDVTGKIESTATGCVEFGAFHDGIHCIRRDTQTRYRALTSLTFDPDAPLVMSYATSATAISTLANGEAGTLNPSYRWVTNEDSLP